MLFVDNPVGTGFSYTESPGGYATNVATVASDMLVLLKHFFTERPEFQVRQLIVLYEEPGVPKNDFTAFMGILTGVNY